MDETIEILPLHPFTQAEVWPLLDGYETRQVFRVEKSESDALTRFEIRLVTLDEPIRDDFYTDFRPEEIEWYHSLLPQGYSFGAYQAGRLVGIAIGECFPKERRVRVWEFHVLKSCRRAGVGRALMTRVLEKARADHLGLVMLETQNTNVDAVRFYRRMGFTLEAIDIGSYYPSDNPVIRQQTQFIMKQWLE